MSKFRGLTIAATAALFVVSISCSRQIDLASSEKTDTKPYQCLFLIN